MNINHYNLVFLSKKKSNEKGKFWVRAGPPDRKTGACNNCEKSSTFARLLLNKACPSAELCASCDDGCVLSVLDLRDDIYHLLSHSTFYRWSKNGKGS